MFILITGGSGSGKSAFAEELVQSRFLQPYFYIATMQPFGEESLQRIKRHQKMRKGKGFETLECYCNVADAAVSFESTVLLECMSNLTANIRFQKSENQNQIEKSPALWGEEILAQIKTLLLKTKNLVAVTNEVFSDGIRQYGKETQDYLAILGRVNRGLAELAQEVYEVVYGIPIRLK